MLDLADDELIIDNFAGGGGASLGIEMALGRGPDIAINHDAEAVAMHTANHPHTHHLCEDVWDVNPRTLARRPDGSWHRIALVWLSPDCKHFSKAKGGKPVDKKIRGLAWTALRWASLPQPAKPRVMMLENVEEFVTWGPLIVDADGNARPDPKRKGHTFNSFVNALRRQGFHVDWRDDRRACDFGAPTIRKRLILIARSDGKPIVWPEPTHGDPESPAVQRGKLLPWRTAAECIDWSKPCISIFLNEQEARAARVKRPLARPTQARMARGLDRFVLKSTRPFIVPLTHQGSDARVYAIDEPLRTVTNAHRGEMALVSAHLMTMRNAQKPYNEADRPAHTVTAGGAGLALVTGNIVRFRGDSAGSPLDAPLPTVTAGPAENPAGAAHALGVEAVYLAQHNAGWNDRDAREVADPFSTISAKGSQQQLVSAYLSHAYGSNTNGGAGSPARPLKTVTADGNHHFVGAAYLTKYYGNETDGQPIEDPMHTVTTKERLAAGRAVMGQETLLTDEQRYAAWWVARWFEEFVPDDAPAGWPAGIPAPRRAMLTVTLQDDAVFAVVDIGMRMLTARELYRAQGFPDSYVIEITVPRRVGRRIEMRPLPGDAQNRMCGNSVSPPWACAHVRANFQIANDNAIQFAEAGE